MTLYPAIDPCSGRVTPDIQVGIAATGYARLFKQLSAELALSDRLEIRRIWVLTMPAG